MHKTDLPPCLPRGDAASLGFDEQRLARLAARLDDEVARGRIPGAVALIARRGQLAWDHATGRLSPRDTAPMGREALFRIYSMTKPVVSLAIMMFVEEGRLLLSDPIGQWLPEWADPKVLSADGETLEAARQPITIQDLLRHTSGLTYGFTGTSALHLRYQKVWAEAVRMPLAQASAHLATLPLQFQPGTVWQYSHATDVLGRLVEVLAQDTLGKFLQQRIFEPLGMFDTAFWVPPEQQHRIAEPFDQDPDTGESQRLLNVRVPAVHEMGGGGLVSTAGDYLRFLQMMQNGGELDGVRLVSPATVEWMVSDHLGTRPPQGDLLPEGHGFGLGLAVRKEAGLSTMPGSAGTWHWGGIAGTTFWVDPAREIAAVLMLQAPGLRNYYRPLFRSMVYAALLD